MKGVLRAWWIGSISLHYSFSQFIPIFYRRKHSILMLPLNLYIKCMDIKTNWKIDLYNSCNVKLYMLMFFTFAFYVRSLRAFRSYLHTYIYISSFSLLIDNFFSFKTNFFSRAVKLFLYILYARMSIHINMYVCMYTHVPEGKKMQIAIRPCFYCSYVNT